MANVSGGDSMGARRGADRSWFPVEGQSITEIVCVQSEASTLQIPAEVLRALDSIVGAARV
jgi:hypothetical protein